MTKFIERLSMLLSERNLTKKQLLKELHLGKNSFINWDSRNTIPCGKTLLNLSKYFGVSVDYLLGNEQFYLNSDEKKLIILYRSLTDEHQKELLNKIDIVAQSQNKK